MVACDKAKGRLYNESQVKPKLEKQVMFGQS